MMTHKAMSQFYNYRKILKSHKNNFLKSKAEALEY